MTTESRGGAPGWRELRAHRIARDQQARAARKQQRRAREVEDDEEEEQPQKRKGKRAAGKASQTKPRIGFVRASAIERAFIGLIYLGVLLLIVLSIVGTFYGANGENAPITDPVAIWAAFWAGGARSWVAIGVQVVLSLTQYGARQLARHDARWWLLYLAALGISVYFNIQAYYTPLLAYMLPGYVYLLILAFDVFPEFVSIRHD